MDQERPSIEDRTLEVVAAYLMDRAKERGTTYAEEVELFVQALEVSLSERE